MKRHDLADGPDVLKRVTVRLIEGPERPRFDCLLEQKYYLCSARMVGRRRADAAPT